MGIYKPSSGDFQKLEDIGELRCSHRKKIRIFRKNHRRNDDDEDDDEAIKKLLCNCIKFDMLKLSLVL